jgi:hypothetical protein
VGVRAGYRLEALNVIYRTSLFHDIKSTEAQEPRRESSPLQEPRILWRSISIYGYLGTVLWLRIQRFWKC